MLICKHCNKECSNKKGLSYHIKTVHNQKYEDYLIQFEYDGKRPTCACGCGKQVNFFSGKFCEYAHKKDERGIPKSKEHREKISATQRGRKLPDEHKKNISKGLEKMYQEHPERAEHQSNLLTGRKYTDEHRRKISETRKRMFKEGTLQINVEKMQESIVKLYLEGGFAWAHGKHLSPKTHKEHYYRSSWELRHMQNMDNDPDVVTYESEPFQIDYKWGGRWRRYLPDYLVTYTDGHKEMHEVGVKSMKEGIERNVAKQEAGMLWCSDRGYTYKLISFDL